MDQIILIGTVFVFACLAAAWAFTFPGLREQYLPSGPPSLPLIGNLNIIPRTGIHLQYVPPTIVERDTINDRRLTKWAKAYGPVFSLKIGPGTMVVLTSAFHATNILDKRSLHYSNRPPSYIIGQSVFGGDHPMFMGADDERWKLRRKLYFQMLQESRCNKDHVGLIEAEAVQLARDMMLEPSSLMYHPGRYSNSMTMSLVFGVRTPTYNTPHYLALQKIMTDLSALGEIGATPPVDLLYVLKFFPQRLWGNWKTRAALLRKSIIDLYTPLVEQVLERREKIGTGNSFLDGVFDQQDKLELTRNEIVIMAGNLLEGGTDTMATTILTFCQAMALHPDVQEDAQKQMDAVLDDSCSPCWSDYDRLPFVSMIVKELLRWRPPAPGGFPHAVTKDDEIDGMKIPKGSTVVLNIWGVHHDAARYKNPDKFLPSRFEGQTQPASVYANASNHEKRDHFAYGAGRRICPGIHLAERALFLAIAKLLWAFTIKPKIDATGQQVPVDVGPATAYCDGFLNQCRPFEADINVRSEKRRETLLAEVARAEVGVFSGYE